MNHEHMNVKDEVEQTGPKKPWVTPRLEEIEDTETGLPDARIDAPPIPVG